MYDILCKRPFDEEGPMQLKVMHALDDVELWVSAKPYTDIFYLIRREIGSLEAQEVLEDTLTWLHACSVEEDNIRNSLGMRWPDFEDCLVNTCAERIKADFIVTRDEKGFSRSAFPHGSASEFMDFVFEMTNVRYSIEGLV